MSTDTDLRDDSRPRPASTLYAGRDIVVTRRWVLGHDFRYSIAELSSAVRIPGTRHPSVHAAVFIASVDLLLLLPAALVAGGTAIFLLAIGAVIVAYLVAWVCERRWPPRHELWARHHGTMVRLFSSPDEQEFGQVSRAVLRAMESAPRDLP